MREADRIAKKVLARPLAKKIESLSDEKAKNLEPELKALERFFDDKEYEEE